jgi:hypothetical protein
MRATIWKAVFAAMNPSPILEAIAEFAELRADQHLRTLDKRTGDTNGFSMSREGSANGPKSIRIALQLISRGQLRKHSARRGRHAETLLSVMSFAKRSRPDLQPRSPVPSSRCSTRLVVSSSA